MKKRQQVQAGLLKVTCHSKSENINFEGASGKDLAERITSLPTRADDKRVITNPVEVKSIKVINVAESTSDVVDLLLSNETENERIFIHHEEAINQTEIRRSKTGMESTSQKLHTANTSLNPLGAALMKATTMTPK